MFILASHSPQRKDILEKLGVEFEVIPNELDESSITESDPVKRACLLAEAKAESVAEMLSGLPAEDAASLLQESPSVRFAHSGQHSLREGWVIGCDTLVVSEDGQLLEKPLDEEDARRMLALHSGKTSTIHSSLCLQKGNEKHTDVSTAKVTFKDLYAPVDWPFDSALRRSGPFDSQRSDGFTMSERQERSDLTRIEWWIQTGLWRDRSGAFQIDGEGQKLVESLEGEFETVVGFPVEMFRRMLEDYG